jgi:glycosyltransferase involved in cell wall biosynthesis
LRVGVVVPTHGAGAHLVETLDSVAAQTFTDWSLVVVSDGSSDDVLSAARRLADRDPRVVVIAQVRAGVAAARNRGLDQLRGRVDAIALLDHDDRWFPDTLARLTAALSRTAAGIVGVHGLGRFIDGRGMPVRPGEMEAHLRRRLGIEGRRLRPWPPERPTGFANLAFSNCIPIGSALVKSAAFDRAGSFDPRTVPADDYDMWLRLARLGEFAFLDEVVMEYRRGEAPTWQRPRGGVAFAERKALTSPANTPEQARLARRGYRIKKRWTVADALGQAAALGRRGDIYAAARKLARAALHAAAYVRGAPIADRD